MEDGTFSDVKCNNCNVEIDRMADLMSYIDKTLPPSVKMRQCVERRITDEIVKALFAKDFVVRVYDGEAFCTRRTTDPVVVQKAVQSTDEDHIVVYEAGGQDVFGRIMLTYGNDGYDVVSDYSMSLEAIVGPILEKYR